MKIKLDKAVDGEINRVTDKKELMDVYQACVISKGKIESFATVRWLYSPRADGMQRIYCNVFIGGNGVYLSGTGDASGCGYCKRSAAFADALQKLGIDTSEDVSGRGMESVNECLAALGKALGYTGNVTVLTG